MKKFLAISILLFPFCFLVGIQAQTPKLSKEEFRERQREFIIRRAELTNEEADRFFPLYFELQDKKGAHNKEAMDKMKKGKDPATSEEEYRRIVEGVIQARITNDELDLEYVRKYSEFLTAKKIYAIQKAEMRFHRELLKGTHIHEKNVWDKPPGDRPE